MYKHGLFISFSDLFCIKKNKIIHNSINHTKLDNRKTSNICSKISQILLILLIIDISKKNE